MKTILSLQVMVLVFVVTSCTTYAFASSNENPAMQAGEGANAISGWAISNVHYRLAENPSRLSAVEFDLDQPADLVKVSFDGGGSEYFPCVNVSERHWVCDVRAQVELQSMSALRVVALGEK
ncbi:MAG: hypothetical protein ACOYYI_15185 [Chloroflexota bacterium]